MRGLTGQQGPPGPPGPRSGGAIYTRWGKSSCPLTPSTQLVYAGQIGGSYSGQSGCGANFLCMLLDPQYSSYTSGVQGNSYMYGAEYEQPIGGTGNDDATYAVCYVSMVQMVPAKSAVRHLGPENIMVTLCQHTGVIVVVHHLYVLMEHMNRYRVVKGTGVMDIYTMWKLSVVLCLVLLM